MIDAIEDGRKEVRIRKIHRQHSVVNTQRLSMDAGKRNDQVFHRNYWQHIVSCSKIFCFLKIICV